MDKCSEESENEVLSAFQSLRMNKTGIYWSESPPAWTQTRPSNILRKRPGPVRGFRITTPRDAFKSFIMRNIINEVIQCTNLEGRRVTVARGKVWKKLIMKI